MCYEPLTAENLPEKVLIALPGVFEGGRAGAQMANARHAGARGHVAGVLLRTGDTGRG